MKELSNCTCEACRADAPQVSTTERKDLHRQIPDWDVVLEDGVQKLVRQFLFPDFGQALAFTVKVGELAEGEGHHPDILLQWGKTTVTWYSHKIDGLHRNDFIMAAKTDRLPD